MEEVVGMEGTGRGGHLGNAALQLDTLVLLHHLRVKHLHAQHVVIVGEVTRRRRHTKVVPAAQVYLPVSPHGKQKRARWGGGRGLQ